MVWVTRFAGPEVLAVGEAPDPVAGAGEVVIEVAVADVLFLDTQLRSGWGREYFDLEPPYVPGSGVVGRVIATGQGVDPGWAGRDVVAIVAAGGYAERVVARADGLARVPDGLGMPTAAALVQTGPAALSLLDAAHLQRGEWVLVMPAAGGLGILLVQLARRAGGRVIAAAGGQPKLQLARDLGAETVVDYAAEGWAERVRDAAGGAGPAVVFDGVGGRLRPGRVRGGSRRQPVLRLRRARRRLRRNRPGAGGPARHQGDRDRAGPVHACTGRAAGRAGAGRGGRGPHPAGDWPDLLAGGRR